MNNSLPEITRPGLSRVCPSCAKQIRYTFFNITYGVAPFFYSAKGGAVLFRRSDAKPLEALLNDPSLPETKLKEWVDTLLAKAPIAPDGSRFTLTANVRCPHCTYEFPYAWANNLHARLTDPKVPLIDGMLVIGDSVAESYKVRVES